ncbi:TMEM175 family protein [Glaciihabitans sp. dw_435]|uniref:TMEM175 family protein n=1 Tax=Glaciihabitans sp. dw_435 TaxID=2720081 RepID=UPI001BD1F65D|nr:TMEM175 family protein [Glaciihabitans sp. dw_435]
MATERGLDRVVFFTDAVVAIAITLLVLPLVDLVPKFSTEDGANFSRFVKDNRDQLLGFGLSFVVIASLWRTHHAVFQHVRAYTQGILRLTLLWAFTIVLLPLPTALISELPTEPLSIAAYVGTMTLSSLVLTTITITIYRNPKLSPVDYPMQYSGAAVNVVTTVLFATALIVAVFVPHVNLWAMLLLLLIQPVTSLVTQLHARRQPAGSIAPAQHPADTP